MSDTVLLGYEVGSGAKVNIPVRHMVVTGQTQEAGKTTALEALIQRSGLSALCFVTKRGEGSFHAARRVEPYFREQTDWQFVRSILEASRGEKLKFETAWIIRASKGARTLADVQRNVRKLMDSAKGMSADVYLTLDAYLEQVVPQIARVRWASSVTLGPGVNAMDLTALNVEMQHLVIKSSLDWVLQHGQQTLVVVPEAWKFIPQGRGTPVKLSAEAYIRQGAGLGNYLWLDSQDIAGVEKIILKSVPLWIMGVQREANEVKRTLAQMPAGLRKPKAEQIATLGLGQFYVCHGTTIVKTYVRPAWMDAATARQAAIDGVPPPWTGTRVTDPPPPQAWADPDLIEADGEIGAEDQAMAGTMPSAADIAAEILKQGGQSARADSTLRPLGSVDDLYEAFKQRLLEDAASDPQILRVLRTAPELVIETTPAVMTAAAGSYQGRIGILIADGKLDAGLTHGTIRKEMERTGNQVNSGSLSRELKDMVSSGFLIRDGNNYVKNPAARVTKCDKRAG